MGQQQQPPPGATQSGLKNKNVPAKAQEKAVTGRHELGKKPPVSPVVDDATDDTEPPFRTRDCGDAKKSM